MVLHSCPKQGRWPALCSPAWTGWLLAVDRPGEGVPVPFREAANLRQELHVRCHSDTHWQLEEWRLSPSRILGAYRGTHHLPCRQPMSLSFALHASRGFSCYLGCRLG